MYAAALPKGEKVDFLTARPIGAEFTELPQISHLQAADLDRDGLLDVVVCDAQKNQVSWIRQLPTGGFLETVLNDDLIAPAHVQVIDFDRDGDLDLIVAVLGMLFPNNDRIGSVVILEQTDGHKFVKHTLIEQVARVSDVRAGDLDGDKDLDLAVAQFGYDDGETRWLENLGDWKFESHILQTLSGPVNCEVVDIDNDGDLDIVLLISQEWEEIYIFINDGQGRFSPKLIYGSTNDDFGSSGITLSDFDRDGDQDIIYTNGDAFDYIPPRPRPWHGVQWLENLGDLEFKFHRIADYAGAFSPRPLDIDQDGDLDLIVASSFNLWEKPEAQSLILLENDGQMRFSRRDITNTPTHILVVDSGDFNGDGQIDLVTGGMHTFPPHDRLGRVVLWLNGRGLQDKR
ncbi:MAG: VCBS repeat-containing protein [Deltaproteobacteria bacterium]|nr:VCBS repeat-containing protein [Deltaproteobacteria bacterium]